MATIVTEIYEALRKAGVDEQMAKDAARAVIGADATTELATKADLAELKLATRADLADLRADIANMKVELIKWNVGAMAALTAIFAAIVRLG